MNSSGDASRESPVLDPQIWKDILASHTAKGDMFSVKTLMTILEGIENLAKARQQPNCAITVTSFNSSLFERLQGSFNNPALLKAVGLLYLGDFAMPGTALKHFELARQLAPNDRDLAQLEKAATLALARAATDQATHTPLNEVSQSKPQVEKMIRQSTTRLHRVQTRPHLSIAGGEAGQKTSPGASRAEGDFSTVFNEIDRLIQQSLFADAFAALADAAQTGAPAEEVQALYSQLGLAAFDMNRMADALAAYLKMRDMTPESVEGWFNCGLTYQKMGMLDEALDCYEHASQIDPANASTWCNLSSILFEQGDYPGAENAARKALELRPDYPRAFDTLAATLTAVDRLPEAEDVCRQAIRLQPNLHSAWFKLGIIKFQQENFVAAEEAFNLTGDNPDFFPYVLFYLCMIDARRGRFDEAMEHLQQARAADPGNDLEPLALKELGSLCTKLGRHDTAADFYTEITVIRPDDVDAWLAKGTAHHRINQYDEARTAYQRVTELEPGNSNPWHNLGLLAVDLGLHEEARDCFQREVELAPEDAKAWYDLAVSWQTLGNKEEEARAFAQAESLTRSNVRRSSDLSAAMSIVRRLNLGDRVLKTGELG